MQPWTRFQARWVLVAVALAGCGRGIMGSSASSTDASRGATTLSYRPEAGTGAAEAGAAEAGAARVPEPAPDAATSSPDAATAGPASDAAPAGRPAPLRLAVIGDFGEDSAEEGLVAALVKSWKPDAVITVGDDNYPDGAAATIDANIGKYYQEFIGKYVGKYGPGSATNRFWPSAGNHDWVAPGLKPYLDYFTLPGNERYYDVDLGLVHLFAVDSDPAEPDGVKAGSKQALWLKDRLGASNSCYDLVYFHHPPYSSGEHGSTTDMRWPFAAWGADAVLSGHEHDYERLQADGLPYFVNGLGGRETRPFAAAALPETKVRLTTVFGAMLITATPTGITYEFWTAAGARMDSLTVAKTCP